MDMLVMKKLLEGVEPPLVPYDDPSDRLTQEIDSTSIRKLAFLEHPVARDGQCER